MAVVENTMQCCGFWSSRWWSLPILIPCLLPAGWRLIAGNVGEDAGIYSDLGLGLVLFVLAILAPRWLRFLSLLFWALIQIIATELLAAVGRFPSWQDVQYLLDPHFLSSSATGLHLAEPLFTGLTVASVLLTLPVPKAKLCPITLSLLFCSGIGLVIYVSGAKGFAGQSVSSRYNPLHWLVADALSAASKGPTITLVEADLPESLRRSDLDGESLLGEHRTHNVLIITLEGISGIFHPEVRQAMGVAAGPFQMEQLDLQTRAAMLIPDFVTHSHQTIRGLYALHCGDFSKLSYDTPKGMELLLNPKQAAKCLPARLRNAGWTTHYLQGAPLQFMNKDRVMPAMGFEEVHGLEWFNGRELEDFVWGTTDPDFFAGALDYLHHLGRQDRPWLLSLLTVATHQPFDAPQDLLDKYGDRKIAAVAKLDMAVAEFLNRLRQEGLLDSTLVLVTTDESHGSIGADWHSSWGTMMVLAPGDARLPRLKKGSYGLVDVEASVLDYLRQPLPEKIIGRSFFRDYARPREMVSYTSGKLRWQTAENRLFECSVDGSCMVFSPSTLLAPNRDAAVSGTSKEAARIFGLAELLDQRISADMGEQRLQFGKGAIRELPAKIRNEWVDNLVGAQYLDFPAGSTVAVDIRVNAVAANPDGIQLRLVMRQFEQEVDEIAHPPFPRLLQGEAGSVQFHFTNQEPRQAFSFHLVGEGAGNVVEIEKFEVAIAPR